MKNYSLKAIVLGCLIAFFTYVVIILVLAISYNLLLVYLKFPRYYLIGNIISTCIVTSIAFINGGFWAGKIAKHKKVNHGLINGVFFAFLYGILNILTTRHWDFHNFGWLMENLFLNLSPILFFPLGAYIAMKQQLDKESSKTLHDQRIEAFGKNQEE